jgi:cytochrome bd-type quinol oxidase subunit 1
MASTTTQSIRQSLHNLQLLYTVLYKYYIYLIVYLSKKKEKKPQETF